MEDLESTALYRGKRHYEFNGRWFCEAKPYSHASRERSDSGVQVVVSDKRISVCDGELEVEYFQADVLAAMDYYPFGMLSKTPPPGDQDTLLRNPDRSAGEVSGMMPDRQWSANSDSTLAVNGFNGMRKDNEINGVGNSLDFGARIYDSRLGRWLSSDPLGWKYPSLTPYNFVDDAPINSIDIDGRDIIILCAPAKHGEGKHPTGHQAILIGNDKDGWYYYSFDNDKSSADGKNDNYTNGVYFKTLDDFANSEHNTFREDYDDPNSKPEVDENGEVVQRYTQGYRIKTDKETDKKMMEAASKTFDKEYSILKGNDCTTVVKNALDEAGLKNGERTFAGTFRECDEFGKGCQEIDYYDRNLLPQDKQKEIERSNEGIDVDEELKRGS